MSKIFTTDIHGLNTIQEHKDFWTILNKLYYKVLINDENWHFFYEGEYAHIRYSEENNTAVTDFLMNSGYAITGPSLWLDDSPIVERYKDEFTELFHTYSVMAIKFKLSDSKIVNENNLYVLSDRVLHCYFNMMFYNALEIYPQKETNNMEMNYELEMMRLILTERAHYMGMLKEGIRNRKYMEKMEKELKEKIKEIKALKEEKAKPWYSKLLRRN